MNDTDLWNDIERLYKLGKTKQADDLNAVYYYKYVVHHEIFFEQAKKYYEETYKDKVNV